MTNVSYKEDIVTVLARIKAEYGVESVYSHFENGHSLPYIAYIGAGQTNFSAGNGIYWRQNQYQVELYYASKNEALEDNVESEFITGGWHFEKSEDIYLDGEDIYYITYDLY